MLKNPQNRKNLLTFDFASDIIVVVSRDGAAWSARLAHNQEVVGSNPTPATKKLFFRRTPCERVFLFLRANLRGLNLGERNLGEILLEEERDFCEKFEKKKKLRRFILEVSVFIEVGSRKSESPRSKIEMRVVYWRDPRLSVRILPRGRFRRLGLPPLGKRPHRRGFGLFCRKSI